MTKVIVIGAGVGGLALGQALTRAGIDVEIHERTADARAWASGYRLNINQTGSRSLHQCLPTPLWDAFVATSVDPGAGLAFRTEQLRDLAVIERDVLTAGATGEVGRHYGVSRAVLRTLLLAGMDTIVRYGHAFQRYERNPDGTVTAYFADGGTATGDVLVGADGANSLVRQQYLPAAPRRETDAMSIAGRLPLNETTMAWLPTGIATGMTCVLPPSDGFLFLSAFDGRRRMSDAIGRGHDLTAVGLDTARLLDDVSDYVLWAFITHHRRYPANVSALDGAELKQQVSQMMHDWHPTLRRIVTDTEAVDLGVLGFKRSTVDYTWAATPVTLLGDAVHNMPPVMGLGANTALRDAAELSATLIAAHHGETALIAAIGTYEAKMREYGFGAVRESTSYTERAISGSRVARQGMKTWLRLCQAMPSMKRRSFAPRWENIGADRPDLVDAAR